MARPALEEKPEAEPERSVRFLPTGSVNLNLVLSGNADGGWARGRIANIVGDNSTGKTLLGVEACACFAALYAAKRVRYVEAEAAFDEDYGEVVGMPADIELGRDIDTVEKFYIDLEKFLKDMEGGGPCLYILDSLDALSDAAELETDFDAGSYGTTKARKMSQFFRRIVNRIDGSECTLIILSQTRTKIGVMFGEKKTRSGGKALDFYASQIVYLSEVGKVTKTIRNVKRVVGIDVKARVKKNKVAPAHRETEFTILFNYGVDDEGSMIAWLKDAKAFNGEELSDIEAKRWLTKARDENDRESLIKLSTKLRQMMYSNWHAIEQELIPHMRKYENT